MKTYVLPEGTGMTRKKIEDFKEDFSLLIEAGFIAVKQLDEDSAKRIFHSAHILNPKSMAPQIGLGYIALNKLLVREATAIFREVLHNEPNNYLAQTFMGICYLLNEPKRKEGKEMIKKAMNATDDETVKNLGAVSLEWASKDLEKMKSPFSISDEEINSVKEEAAQKRIRSEEQTK